MESSDLPSVTVVGLLPNQARRVEAEHGDKVDLQFMEAKTAPSRVRSVAESSDHVILMTKFTAHTMQIALRDHDGLIFCNGGISAVDAILSNLFP